MNRSVKSKRKGFTLTELIVVIVIIGILAVILIPTLTGYIKKAKYSNDVQNTNSLNVYLKNNSILFGDEINSRDDVIDLLKKDNPDKELKLETESEDYYLWYDIQNKQIILETYEALDSKTTKLGYTDGRDDISEFFLGYYFLSEDGSSLANVIKEVNSLTVKGADENYDSEAQRIEDALEDVMDDGYESAYNGFLAYFKDANERGGIPFEGTTTTIKVTFENGEIKIKLHFADILDRLEITTKPNKLEYTALDPIETTGMVVTVYYKDGRSKEVTNYTISPNVAQVLSGPVPTVTVTYKENGMTVSNRFEITVNPIKENLGFEFEPYTYNGSDFIQDIKDKLTSYNDNYIYDVPGAVINAGTYSIEVNAISKSLDYEDVNFIIDITVNKAELDISVNDITLILGELLTIDKVKNNILVQGLAGSDTLTSALNFDYANIQLDLIEQGFDTSVPYEIGYIVTGVTSKNYNLSEIRGIINYVYDTKILVFVPTITDEGVQDANFDENKTYTATYDGDYITVSGYFENLYGEKVENVKPRLAEVINGGLVDYVRDDYSILKYINSDTYKFLVTVSQGEADQGYSVESNSSKTYTVVINKKEITEDMFTVDNYAWNSSLPGKPIVHINEANLSEAYTTITVNHWGQQTSFDKGNLSIVVSDTCTNYKGQVSLDFNIIYEYYTVSYQNNQNTSYRKYLDKFTITSKHEKDGYTLIGYTDIEGGETVKFNLGEEYDETSFEGDELVLYPVFDANEYTITFDTNGGSIVDDITQDYGTTITKPADPTREGYTFAGWDPQIPETMPLDGLTVVAKWTINQYTITFDTDGGSEIAPITKDYGTQVDAPANPTKTGYTFSGWNKEVPSTMPANDVTVKAIWTINGHTITFNTDGGSEITPITQDYGTSVTKPADPTKEGYTFAGWDKEIPSTMPDENITITAKWTVNQYTITFDTDGGSAINPIEQDYGTIVEAPADPTKKGYTFDGWDIEVPAKMPADNITIKAKWKLVDYAINYKYSVSGSINDEFTVDDNKNPIKYTVEDKNIDLLNASKHEYTFIGWFTDEDCTIAVATIDTSQAKDLTIYGKFENRTVVSVTYNEGTLTNTQYYYSDKLNLDGATFKVTYNNGEVDEYFVPSSYTVRYQTENADSFKVGNTIVYVTVLDKEVAITIPAVGKKTVKVLPQDYTITYGDVYDSSKVKYNYDIEVDEGLSTYLKANLDSNITLNVGEYQLTITYEEHPNYNFDVTTKGKLIVNQKSIEGYDFGTIPTQEVNYDIASNPCKPSVSLPNGLTETDVIIDYSNNNQLGEAVAIIKGIGNYKDEVKITFKIKAKVYNLTYNYEGGNDAGNPDKYNWNTDGKVTLTNPVKDHYEFNGWIVDGINKGNDYVIENITSDLELTASWTPVKYNISYQFKDANNNDVTVDTNTNETEYTIESSNLQLKTVSKEGLTFEGWFIGDEKVTEIVPKKYLKDITIVGKFHDKKASTVELVNSPNKLTYQAYDKVDLTGATFKVTYDNSSSEIVGIEKVNGTIYQTNKNHLVSGDTKVTVEVEGKEVEINGITVSKITLTDSMFKQIDEQIVGPEVLTNGVEPTVIKAEGLAYVPEFDAIYSNNKGVGTGVVTLTGKGEFTGIVELEFTISAKEYNITYELDGGNANNETVYNWNTPLVFDANPTKEYYNFNGWYINDNEVTSTEGYSEDITVVAKWTPKDYTITFNTGCDTTVNSITQGYNTKIEFDLNSVVLEKAGFKFMGWDNTLPTNMPANGLTITAKWQELTHVEAASATCEENGNIEYWYYHFLHK